MFDYLTELMLREYFCADVTVGRFIGDKKALFALLGRIFLMTNEDIDRLFALAQSDEVMGIASERDYHQHRRMKQYFEMNGYEWNTDADIDELIDLKGTSLTMAMNHRILHDTHDVRSVACGNLTNAAEGGVILALHLLGILQSEGFAFGKNAVRGRSMIRMAAEWNSEEGLLAALYYDEGNRPKYLCRLYERFLRTGHSDSFAKVEEVYGAHGTKGKREFKLLEKAIGQGILKRDTYVKSYARLLYSEILEEKDKESLMLTPNKELFAEATDLPLKLSSVDRECDVTALSSMHPARADEQGKLARALGNLDSRGISAYRPLCIVSDSKYMLETYADVIAKCLVNESVERIEASDLTDYDLEPSKSNIFIRNCDEDSPNTYFLFVRGEIPERPYDAVKNFLQSAKRGKFRLNRPSVTLDLSAIIPICFCDKEHAKELNRYCDIVRIAEPTKQEKKGLVREILSAKSNVYGADKITVQEVVCVKLSEYSIDDIERILDSAVRENCGDTIQLTDELMQQYYKGLPHRRGTYGFGGSIHEEDRK